MSIDTKDGGSAFPIPHSNEPGAYVAEPGMSLRDYFAAASMTGILGCARDYRGAYDPESRAKLAYEYADAMLKARTEGRT